MSKSKALIIGLVLLLLIWILLLFFQWDNIEKDIGGRVQQQLNANGLDGVSVQINNQGRDVTLFGVARTQEDLNRSVKIAENVEGVREVEGSGIELIPLKKASLLARLSTQGILLKGVLGDENSINQILNVANTFPFAVDNQLSLDADTEVPQWLEGVSSLIPSLKHLHQGELAIDDGELSVQGVVRNQQALDAIANVISSVSGSDGLTSADHSAVELIPWEPSSLSVSLVDGVAKLSGELGTEPDLQNLTTIFKDQFDGVDSSAVGINADVEPAGWISQIGKLAPELNNMGNPRLSVADGVISFGGYSRTEQEIAQLMNTVQGVRDSGAAIVSNIEFKPWQSPELSVVYQDNSLKASGMLPNRSSISLISEAVQSFELSDLSSLAVNPDTSQPEWLEKVGSVVPLMSRFQQSRLDADQNGVHLSGTAATEGEVDSIVQSLTQILGEDDVSQSIGLDLSFEKSAAQVAAEEAAAKQAALIEQCENRWDQLLLENTIKFATGSAEIDPSSTDLLDRLVGVVVDCPGVQIEVGGHTDNTGEESLNQELSEARAQSVEVYLQNAGIEDHRLSSKGYGSGQPIADNATSAGRAENRRIEFNIIK